jgi:hypothetical protein
MTARFQAATTCVVLDFFNAESKDLSDVGLEANTEKRFWQSISYSVDYVLLMFFFLWRRSLYPDTRDFCPSVSIELQRPGIDFSLTFSGCR